MKNKARTKQMLKRFIALAQLLLRAKKRERAKKQEDTQKKGEES